MTKADAEIERKLVWKATKYKLPSQFSLYFKDLSWERQQEISNQIDAHSSGKPILLFARSTNEWTLICTRQVIGHDGHRVDRLDLADMRQMLPHGILPLKDQPKYNRMEINKTEWHQLTITDSNNHPHTFYAQAGPDFFALWNMLLMVRKLVYG